MRWVQVIAINCYQTGKHNYYKKWQDYGSEQEDFTHKEL